MRPTLQFLGDDATFGRRPEAGAGFKFRLQGDLGPGEDLIFHNVVCSVLRANGRTPPVTSGFTWGSVVSGKLLTKLFTILFASVALWCARAGQIDTNRITFQGEFGWVSNATPVRVEHSKLIYRTPGGGGGMVKLADLPEGLRERFHFDWHQAEDDERADSDAKRRRAKAAAAVAQEEAARVEHVEGVKRAWESLTVIWGRVSEKRRSGYTNLVLIVHADSHPEYDGEGKLGGELEKARRAYAEEIGKPEYQVKDNRQFKLETGTICLTDYPGWFRVLEDDVIVAAVYPTGRYTLYGEREIRKFSCSLAEAAK